MPPLIAFKRVGWRHQLGHVYKARQPNGGTVEAGVMRVRSIVVKKSLTNDYSNKRFKKESEQESLNYFLEAYQSVTGRTLDVLEVSERPDFICIRGHNAEVGAELAKVRRGHPNDILSVKLIEKRNYMSIEHALEMIQVVVLEKERKRNEPDWRLPEATFLLIELTDIPLAQIEGCISPEIVPDIYSTGFEEIWLVDFTGLEAYDNVELFCIRPDEWMGYHPRRLQKPYIRIKRQPVINDSNGLATRFAFCKRTKLHIKFVYIWEY